MGSVAKQARTRTLAGVEATVTESAEVLTGAQTSLFKLVRKGSGPQRVTAVSKAANHLRIARGHLQRATELFAEIEASR